MSAANLSATINEISQPDRRFFASLHGLRGIAVMYVVLSHMGNGGYFLLPIAHDAIGKVGVWIFFALSAFLLTNHLYIDFEATSSRVTSLLQYIVHRVFRIYPLYIFVLIGHVILGDISKIQLLKHLLLIQGWGELWAISVEFQYYLLIPVFVISALHLRVSYFNIISFLVALAAGSVVYGLKWPASVFSNELTLFPKLAPFVLGSMLALLLSKAKQSITAWGVNAEFISLTCLVGLLVTTVLYRSIAKGYISDSFASLLSVAIGVSVVGLIYVALMRCGIISRLLAVRPLVFLGKISFSIYLLHMFVIRLVQTSDLPNTTQAYLSLGLCIFCASISYWAIERPGIYAG